jgi:predicted TIM-barrel fold metal-dependent hydrolase
MAKPILVDAHVHAFLATSAEYPRTTNSLYPHELAAPVEGLLDTMDSNGVDHAVLVALTHHDEYLSECLKRYPERLEGILVHNPEAEEKVAPLLQRVQETAAQGVRLYGLGPSTGPAPEDLELFPMFTAIRDFNLKLWVHLPPDDFARLEKLLDAIPEMTVVLNHLSLPLVRMTVDKYGRPRLRCALPPATMAIVERLSRFPNVYVIFSGQFGFSDDYPYLDLADVARRVYHAFGTGRMMWGSDWPWPREVPGYAPMLELVDHLLPDLTSNERSELTGLTAARLFNIAERAEATSREPRGQSQA